MIGLRRKRRWGADHIAFETGLAASTVQNILRAEGMARLDAGDRAIPTAAQFWHRAHRWFAAHGIVVERVLTDTGSC